MADILLVHGSCHGAWCWENVLPLLARDGHRARAIDLPGHGADKTEVGIVTLDAYARAIVGAMTEKTVLVGHSMGGYAIAAAASLAPEQVDRLVYLCAYVPQEGISLAQMRMQAPRQPVLPAITVSRDGSSFTIDPQKAVDLFYHDCAPDIAARAVARLCPQATAPTNVPFAGSAALSGLPRDYIICTDDRTIPPEFQATMTHDWPTAQVQHMPCGHSPFYADPEGLVQALETALRRT